MKKSILKDTKTTFGSVVKFMPQRVLRTPEAFDLTGEPEDPISLLEEGGEFGQPVSELENLQTVHGTDELNESQLSPWDTDLERPSKVGKEVVRATNDDSRQMPFMFSVEGNGYEKTFTVRDFKKLEDSEKVFIGIGQVQTDAYSCYDTEEKKIEYVAKLFNKGKGLDEFDASLQSVRTILSEGVENGLIQENGNGPELTSKGVDRLNGKLDIDRSDARNSDLALIELGDEDLLESISNEDPFTEADVLTSRRFPAQAYGLLKLLINSNGKIKSKQRLTTVIRELSNDGILVESNKHAIKYLANKGLVVNESSDRGTDLTITGKGIATYNVFSQDEKNLVRESKGEVIVPGGRAHEILHFLSGGCFEIDEGSSGWLFGKNSKGSVVDRVYDDIQGTRDGVQRMFNRLVERGYIETVVGFPDNLSIKIIVNARLSEKGLTSLELANSQ